MIRYMSFLGRREGLARPEFFDWWLGQHRRLAEALPGLRRYVISTALEDSEDGPFDGVAELWFDDEGAAAAAFATEQGRRTRADGDAHTARIERLTVVEHPFVDRGGDPRFKLVAALKRRPDLDRAAFGQWWLERHAPLVVVFPDLARYRVSLVEAGPETFADGVAEVCFDDADTMRRVLSSAQVKSAQGDSHDHAAAAYRLWVEEHPIV